MPNRDTQLRAVRKDYKSGQLIERNTASDPFVQLNRWLDEAIAAKIWEPNAMALATCGSDLRPAVRIVLLKGLDARGLTFYTNYRSSKARQIAQNPKASLLFWWGPLERQVRIEGNLVRVPTRESDLYFAQRPRAAQIGAWASPQSKVIPNRQHLEKLWRVQMRASKDKNLARPAHWGGYILIPSKFEFWQGRSSRLHDRIAFKRARNGSWLRTRLAP